MRFDNWTDLASRHVPLRLDELAVHFEIFTEHLEDPSEQSSPSYATLPQMKSTKNCVNAGETVSHLACMVN